MTTTANSSAVVKLYQDVATYFAALTPGDPSRGASVVFGARERWKHINEGSNGANRVVVVPGTLEGQDGELEGPTGPGEVINADGSVTPRTLFDQLKVVTFCVWAADPADPQSVDATVQQQAIEQMFEYVVQAVKRSGAGMANAEWVGAPTYNANPNELRFGLEYRAVLALDTRIFDHVPVAAFPAGANVTRKAGLT